MERYQNIYQSAREGAGLTQEKAAEMLGWVGAESAGHEQEDRTPTPVRVAEMARRIDRRGCADITDRMSAG